MKVPIDEVVYFDAITNSPTTGAATDADSTPTFAVYEEATDTDIGVGGNLTKRTSLTGDYRGTFTASAANGFEAGKWYSVIVSATVGAVAGKAAVMHFVCVPAESVAGVPKVDPSTWDGTDITTGVPLAPATAGRTLVVDAAGLADANVVKVGPTGSGTAQTAGDVMGLFVLRASTAQNGGSGTTIVLDAGASATDGFYIGRLIALTSGTGVGRVGLCTAYIGATKTAAVARSWVSSPDNTTTFIILRTWGDILGVNGTDLSNLDATISSRAAASVLGAAVGASISDDIAAVKTDTAAILVDTGTTLDGRIPAALVGGRMDASVGAIAAGVDLSATMKASVTTAATAATPTAAAVTGNVGGSVGSLATQAKADVNAEVVDALNVDTYAEPGQGAPAATASIAAKIGYLFKFLRNKKTKTATTTNIFADDATTVDHKTTDSDDGTTATRGEVASGP